MNGTDLIVTQSNGGKPHAFFITEDGKKYRRMFWSDMMQEYPNKWVIITDWHMIKGERICICTLIHVCKDEADRDVTLSNILKEEPGAIAVNTGMGTAVTLLLDIDNFERISYGETTEVVMKVPKKRLTQGQVTVTFNWSEDSDEVKIIDIRNGAESNGEDETKEEHTERLIKEMCGEFPYDVVMKHMPDNYLELDSRGLKIAVNRAIALYYKG